MNKKLLTISIIAVLGLSVGCLKSGQQTPEEESKSHEKRLEKVGEKNIHDQWQGKSMPYLYHGGWSVAADFIYWRADEEGLEYAASAGKHETAHQPAIRWSPGFKAGIGYTFGSQDFWDLFLRYTYFQTHQSGQQSGTLLPWWSPTVLGPTATKASADWTLHYNVLDLELGRDYFVCKTLAFRPLVGLRGALIKQHYEAHYDGVFTIGGASSTFPTEMTAENKFSGGGIRAGAQMSWHFTRDWAVNGSISGSLLYGRFNVSQELDDVIGSAASENAIHQELSKVAPNLEAYLGFQWDRFFCENKYHVAVSLSYEFSEWFAQNQMIRSELISGNGQTATHLEKIKGDLGLQGATLELRFDF
jgi:hypothetical protein